MKVFDANFVNWIPRICSAGIKKIHGLKFASFIFADGPYIKTFLAFYSEMLYGKLDIMCFTSN